MADWPGFPPLGDAHILRAIAPTTLNSVFLIEGTLNQTVVWPTANLAIFVPFRVCRSETITHMATGYGSATSGNVDLGVYTAGGELVVSTGSTAQGTAGEEHIIDVTDTDIHAGMYYLAVACDNTTGRIGQFTSTTNRQFARIMGCRQMASAFPLPSTATLGGISSTGAGYYPMVGCHLKARS